MVSPITLVTINALILDAREVGRIENKILDHGRIKAKLYIMEPDKNGNDQIRNATYVVEAEDPTNLRRTFTQLKDHMKSKIFINC